MHDALKWPLVENSLPYSQPAPRIAPNTTNTPENPARDTAGPPRGTTSLGRRLGLGFRR